MLMKISTMEVSVQTFNPCFSERSPKMNTKSKMLVYVLIAVILMLQTMPVSAQGETPPLVEVMISDEPSNEDANWPIVRTETRKRKNPSTGMEIIETTVIRRRPPTKENKDCEKQVKLARSELNSMVALATGCTLYRSSITTSATSLVGGGSVTAYAKNYADQYCNGAGVCNFVKMKKLEIYWTRTSTSFGVINAKTVWGCIGGGCWLCQQQLGLTYYNWVGPYFNPVWSTSLKTKTYTYTSTSITTEIIMASLENGGFPSGGNDATATAPRTATPLSVYATFVFP
jgi:hypothetical protein